MPWDEFDHTLVEYNLENKTVFLDAKFWDNIVRYIFDGFLMIVENKEFWFSKDSHWNSGINNPFQYKKSSTSKIYFIYFGVDFLVLISCTEIDYNTIIAVWILFFSFIISFLFRDGKV